MEKHLNAAGCETSRIRVYRFRTSIISRRTNIASIKILQDIKTRNVSIRKNT